MRRLLIVEDHRDTAFLMMRLFSMRGFEVIVAMSVADAKAAAAAKPVDILVSDIGLGDGSGHDVVKHVKSVQPHVKAVALSGYAMSDDINVAKASGFDRYFAKPVHFNNLVKTVEDLANGHGNDCRT